MSDEAMLRAIAENLDDDAPRAVYADLLQQRGDPRGEFIHLQLLAAKRRLTPAERKRHDALLREHEQRWLGPLAELLGVHKFERGFLTEVLTAPRNARLLDASALQWLTVERATYPTPKMGPQFRRLREMSLASLDDLKKGSFPDLHTLDAHGEPAHWRTFFREAVRFPKLQHLGFSGSPALASELLTSSLGPQLRSFEEHDSTQLLSQYAEFVFASQLTRFGVASATLLKTALGWELELKAPVRDEPLRINVLSGMKPDALTRLKLTGSWVPMKLEWARESIAKMPLRALFEQAVATRR